jgi:hypothetical protein
MRKPGWDWVIEVFTRVGIAAAGATRGRAIDLTECYLHTTATAEARTGEDARPGKLAILYMSISTI